MTCLHTRSSVTWLLLVVANLIALPTWSADADCTHPLTMEGKKTLFQRVLTRPGNAVADDPGGEPNQPLVAFSRLFVYERVSHAGKPWIAVGTDDACQDILGWVPASATVPWRQQLTLALTNPAGRTPLLFFRDRDALTQIFDQDRPGSAASKLVKRVREGEHPASVLALEPSTYVDLHEQFYLLPILETLDLTTPSGRNVRALRVASVTRPDVPTPTQAPVEEPAPIGLQDFRTAIIFVVDSTISMRPYIDETRAAVEHFYERIRTAKLLDRVAFGLVGFRAHVHNKAQRRQLEYVAKVFASPTEVHNVDEFMARIKNFNEASATTDYFDEDAFAGVKAALDIPDWKERFAGRFIVLITDAGALDGTGNLLSAGAGKRGVLDGVQSKSRLGAASLQALAAREGIAIAVLHLRTPEAKAAGNVPRAEDQYRTLSFNAAFNRQAYFPIADGSRTAFRGAMDEFANAVIDLLAEQSTAHSGAFRNPPPPSLSGTNASASAELSTDPGETARLLGHAMTLAYLGEREQTAAPEVFEAWIADTDPADPGLVAVEPHVLMTRNDLSNLRDVVTQVVEIAEGTLTEATTASQFYDRLQSVAAYFSRREGSAGAIREASGLAEQDLLLEYLEDLPYRSDVLSLKRDDWSRWGIQRQSEFIDRLKKKANLYQAYYGAIDGWVDIAQTGDSYTRQSVFPVPLRDLP